MYLRWFADHGVLRGTIEWDDSQDGPARLLSVDDREITWQEFGRMLMSFERSRFKLEIRGKSWRRDKGTRPFLAAVSCRQGASEML